jgi:small-conductance mechanosensitive channel
VLARPLEIHDAILASSFAAGGIVVGIAFDLLIRRRLKRRGSITTWGGDHVVLAALRTSLLLWFSAGGLAAAAAALPLRAHVHHIIGKALVGLVVGATTLAIARAVSDSIKLYSLRTAGAVRSSSIFVTLARLAIFALGLLVLLQMMGVSITPLLTALGVGGLAVALALQDTLANLFAGIHILASKKVRLGDFVRLEDASEGYVVDISWRNTSIRQLTDAVVVVPNAKLASAIVTNFYQPKRETSVLVQCGVDYASDLERVEQITVDVANEVLREVPGGVASFRPLVRYHSFGEYAVEFTVVLRANETTDRFLLIHEFIKRVHRRYEREGIVFPTPVRTVRFETNGELESLVGGSRRD